MDPIRRYNIYSKIYFGNTNYSCCTQVPGFLVRPLNECKNNGIDCILTRYRVALHECIIVGKPSTTMLTSYVKLRKKFDVVEV